MSIKVRGAIVDLEVPYFACFRKPTATSVMLTYPVPPFTTLIGLVANALGVPRQGYMEGILRLQKTLLLNVRPLQPVPRPTRELAKILKLVGEAREPGRLTSFPSSPMHKYLLVSPAYRLYLSSQEETFMAEVSQALRQPHRPLYLGQSDDMVVVQVVWEGEVIRRQTREAFGLLPGAYEGCELLRLPLLFESERVLRYSSLLSLPTQVPFSLPSPQPLFFFANEGVHLFGFEDAAVRQAAE